MGRCKFCGKGAGFLRISHQECARRHSLGTERIALLVADAAPKPGTNIKQLKKEIESTAATSFVREKDVSRYIVEGWKHAVRDSVKRGDFTTINEHCLLDLANHFSIARYKYPCRSVWLEFEKGRQKEKDKEDERKIQAHQTALIQSIKSGAGIIGKWPRHEPAFNLLRSETLVYVFNNVVYKEERITRRSGRKNGRQYPAQYGIVAVDEGLLGITTKHIYFVGNQEMFRIHYNRIVAFKRFNYGIILQRDAMRANKQIFRTGKGNFTYDLVTALAQGY